MDRSVSRLAPQKRFAPHGWLGLLLIAVFWTLNWRLDGPRTHWGFFPLWLGYCLSVDALVLFRTGTSLAARSARKFAGLFLVSAPVWWIFELFNERLMNWRYEGAEYFTTFEFFAWATLNFTTVIPAVFGTAELFASFPFIRQVGRGQIVGPGLRTTGAYFIAGWVMLAMMLTWPRIFFPFLWLSVFFILEPVNVWLGNRSLVNWLKHGDWRPVLALWGGVLVTGFFWEMWNFFSYPKWVYEIPWGEKFHVFEMPLLGYFGYLPFALELFAMYHLVLGLLGEKETSYVRVTQDKGGNESWPINNNRA